MKKTDQQKDLQKKQIASDLLMAYINSKPANGPSSVKNLGEMFKELVKAVEES